MGSWLLSIVRIVDPLASPTSILRLEVGCDALVWVICSSLYLIWSSRAAGKSAAVEDCKARISSDISFMLNTQHRNIAIVAQDLINNI